MKSKNRIIYIGNRLKGAGLNPTTIDTLGDRLKVDFDIIRASHFKNPILRIIHMWIIILLNAQKSSFLIIDTYSSNAFNYAWTCGAIARLIGLNYIPFLHGGKLPERYKKSKKKCQKYFKGAYKIISPSGFLKVETESKFNVQVDIIPNYLEIEQYSFCQRPNVGEVKLLWVRAFHKIYNPTLVPEIEHGLRRIGFRVSCTMVGPDKDGSLANVKKRALNLNVLDSLHFTGRVSKKEWLNLSSDYSFFINTTNADNTPVSVMEAMALGMPVITTDVGGIPYLFENNREGIMVPPKNATLIVNSIEHLIKNSTLTKEISTNARLKAEKWDWSEVKKLWLEILKYE